MSLYPNISKGIGRLTPRVWSKIMSALRWVERYGPAVERAVSNQNAWQTLPEISSFAAVITDWAVDGTSPLRYRYSWEAMGPADKLDLMVSMGATSDGDAVNGMYTRKIYGDKSESGSGAFGPAFNTVEWGYGTSDKPPPGYDTSDPYWSSDFVLQPIQKRSIVIMYMMPSEVLDYIISSEEPTSATNMVPCFCLSNVVMGPCA